MQERYVVDRLARRQPCSDADCDGVRLVSAALCLAHLADQNPSAFEAELKRIGDEGTIDARGVQLSADLLKRILDAAPHQDGRLMLKAARFDGATFHGWAGFDGATFQHEAAFDGATFRGRAGFVAVTFTGEADFHEATFQDVALFDGAIFKGQASFVEAAFLDGAGFDRAIFQDDAWFDRVTFKSEIAFREATFQGRAGFHGTIFAGRAGFHEATFQRAVWFNRATFQHEAWFHRVAFKSEVGFNWVTFQQWAGFEQAQFQCGAGFGGTVFMGDAWFDRASFQREGWFNAATFQQARQVGPLVAKQLVFDDAVFSERVQIEAAAAALCARRAKFPAGARLRLRWASVVLDDADLAAPSSLAGVPPLPGLGEEDAARHWRRLPPGPRAQRWRPRLLSLCRADVAGLRVNNVDLRACRFNGAHNLDKLRIEGEPLFARTRGWWRARRKTLAEEQQWRASRPGRWRPGGWYPRACQPPASKQAVDPHALLAPVQLAALYRELRKGREDAKDEPGAADFYYGEMELRRHNQGAPSAERLVLWLYWLVSGYGLRGLRALFWLTIVVFGLAALLQAIGFDGGDPPLRDALIYAAQSTVSITSSNKALTEHVSWTGEVLRITLRLVGPLLLGLALLSVRNRVKR